MKIIKLFNHKMQCELRPTVTLTAPSLSSAGFKFQSNGLTVHFEISIDASRAEWITFAQNIKSKIDSSLVNYDSNGGVIIEYVSTGDLIACYVGKHGGDVGGDLTVEVPADCFLPAIEQNIRDAPDDDDE